MCSGAVYSAASKFISEGSGSKSGVLDLGGCREGSDAYIGVFDYSLTTIGESIMEG